MATTDANVNVRFVFITEDDLRKVIREEISKVVAAGAIRPPYVPQVPAWWQDVIMCGVSQASPEGTTYNAT